MLLRHLRRMDLFEQDVDLALQLALLHGRCADLAAQVRDFRFGLFQPLRQAVVSGPGLCKLRFRFLKLCIRNPEFFLYLFALHLDTLQIQQK